MAAAVIISGRRKDLGGFEVARLLPHPQARAVSNFVFFDHMGPARLAAGAGVDVRPHPHIGLATVTYLFEGALMHRDSLGAVQEIRPGDVNWMTAGRGIVHSERTPDALRARGAPLHGLQAWVALPKRQEEADPAFDHYPARLLPRVERAGVSLQLVAGEAYGESSPVRSASALAYLAGEIAPGGWLTLERGMVERAIYVAAGEVAVDEVVLAAGQLMVLPAGRELTLSGRRPSRIAYFGGDPLDGERHLWWNFVSSRKERIEQAKADWKAGRFAAVPGETEFIPLPEG